MWLMRFKQILHHLTRYRSGVHFIKNGVNQLAKALCCKCVCIYSNVMCLCNAPGHAINHAKFHQNNYFYIKSLRQSMRVSVGDTENIKLYEYQGFFMVS